MPDIRETTFLNSWIDRSTQHIDMVASWERLVDIYSQLSFIDSLTDQDRMTEFGDIVREVNRFLSKMRKKLATANDIDAAMILLSDSYGVGRNVVINTRQGIAFQKLKQQWIAQGLAELQAAMDMLTEEPEDDNEWAN